MILFKMILHELPATWYFLN